MQGRGSWPFPKQPFRATGIGKGETMPSGDTTGSTTVQPRRFSYSLGQAARAVGKAKSTLSRDVKSGKISAVRNPDGSVAIDPAELHRGPPRDWGCGSKRVLSGLLIGEETAWPGS